MRATTKNGPLAGARPAKRARQVTTTSPWPPPNGCAVLWPPAVNARLLTGAGRVPGADQLSDLAVLRATAATPEQAELVAA